jgi:hypothetical protein
MEQPSLHMKACVGPHVTMNPMRRIALFTLVAFNCSRGTAVSLDASGSNTDGGGIDATPAHDVEVFDPVFPTEPVPFTSTAGACDGTIDVGTDLAENGAAITSLIRDGFEYVANEPPDTPQYIRGVSFQGTFFFDGAVDANGPTFYNDCNNPLETGGVADLTTANFGLTSPTHLWRPSASVLQSRAQLAFYVDPNATTTWTETDGTGGGRSPKCLVGKSNNPTFATYNNAALSPVFLGKTVHIGDIGTPTAPRPIAGVVAVDMVLLTDKGYQYAQLLPAFAGFRSATLSMLHSYNLKTRELAAAPAYGRDPMIAASPDGTHALGIYTPQVALTGESVDAANGYLSARFSNGLNTLMPYIRYNQIPAGSYKFKAYYLAGTLVQVQASMDSLYATFKVLDPRVFDWAFYVTQAAVTAELASPSEDQARLHWVTRGIALGLRGKATFSVRDYLAAHPELSSRFGTHYYAAFLDYLQ